MLAFVLNLHGKPLMPCKPQKAKKLLKLGKAKVVRRSPFTIKLTCGSSGYKQELTAGMDAGSKVIGTAVARESGQVVHQAETHLRGEEIKSKMDQRRMYRKSRRARKTRYRKPGFLNRKASTRLDRLPPSTKHKVRAHLKEKKFIESILPISKWRLELASFDIHAISNPEVSKVAWWTYQRGDMYGYQNLKQYILKRDNYLCQSCKKKTKQKAELHIHHIKFRSNGGTDTKNNLITLCKPCHDKLHKKKDAQTQSLKLKPKPVNTKHATEVSVVASLLRKYFGDFEETFGFITKIDRMEQKLDKRHFVDAAMIASKGMPIKLLSSTIIRRYVAKGDYQQTKGIRSEKAIPTGKLFGLRKFDLILTSKGEGFVKGKRSSGYFSISDIHGNTIHNSVKVKTDIERLSARNKTLTAMETCSPQGISIPPGPKETRFPGDIG
jgi:5-methylcytosine-specific restriction endonuclease McrA